eukprot:TRINITY_DN5158_c0_g1_i1.p1 TRINITY_DN5158_c0_g1~~TRINITY_DN5158_c0_g1_i1.p1  ORF type:complete len:328 (-),score=74.10 TRINITY_DN5158_c0_g1_i1:371-1354(-)
MSFSSFFFFQAEDGIRDAQESRGLGDVYKRQGINAEYGEAEKSVMGWAVVLLASIVALTVSVEARDGDNWVVLVAGSSGWANYRAQADLCAVWHLLDARGNVPMSNVITMMVDDVATSRSNPYQGQLFNAPPDAHGRSHDVREGCRVDYSRDAVSPATFLRVLNGTADGPAIQSKPGDRLFIVYDGLGFYDGMMFPNDQLLLAETFWDALARIEFVQAAIYHTGETSTYLKMPASLRQSVYAVTASAPEQSSYAWFCPSNQSVLATCLANQFSVGWTSGLEQQQTMGDNFAGAADFCWNHGSALMSSNVTSYGASEVVQHLAISEFF